MSREWDARQRSGIVPSEGSAAPSMFGGYGIAPMPSDRIAPGRAMPLANTGLAGLPAEPATPAERAQVRRDWEEMAREWEARQRGGAAAPSQRTR
jgi:hypothetical protein